MKRSKVKHIKTRYAWIIRVVSFLRGKKLKPCQLCSMRYQVCFSFKVHNFIREVCVLARKKFDFLSVNHALPVVDLVINSFLNCSKMTV